MAQAVRVRISSSVPRISAGKYKETRKNQFLTGLFIVCAVWVRPIKSSRTSCTLKRTTDKSPQNRFGGLERALYGRPRIKAKMSRVEWPLAQNKENDVIDGLIAGKIQVQAKQELGKNGSQYVTAKVRATGADGEPLIVNVIAFAGARAAPCSLWPRVW
jgi:hypothetical protein